ncbi:MAG TPA: tetratricopeptide repeat protein, partial [Phycisphaerae bacterium]|nr:tetratricopeptide repeat protein [Phycisphaerae bacterium]
ELEKLANLLTSGDVAVSAAIEGLAGIGKTELAKRLACELSDDGQFSGGIYWLDSENLDLTAEWVRIAIGLGATGSADELVARMMARISQADAPALVVLDNVQTWNQDTQPAPLPSSNCRFLLTTRVLHLGGARFKHFALEILAPDDARALLQKIAGEDILDSEGAQDLLAHLNGHALGIELAASYLAEYSGRETPATYLAKLRAHEHPGLKVMDQTLHGETVAGVLRLQYESLEPTIQHAWLAFSCFEPETVSRKLMAASGLDADAERGLRRMHLIKTDEAGCRMHRLVREFGLSVGEAGERESVRKAFIDGMTSTAREMDISTGYRLYLPDRAHFDTLAGGPTAELPPQEWSVYLDRIATAQSSAGLWQLACANFRLALASALENLGEDHPSVATRHSNLASILYSMGELPEAEQLERAVLEWSESRLGPTHPSTGHRAANLMFTLRKLGRTEEAKNLAKQALEIAQHQPKGSGIRDYIEDSCGWAIEE